MLKSKTTEEEWSALSAEEQKHYTKDATGNYLLQHDDAVALRRAVNTERTRAETAEKALKLLVPGLPEDKTEWASAIAERAEVLKELDTVDIDEWKAHKSTDPNADPKKGKADWEAERLELQKSARETARELATMRKDLEKANGKVTGLTSENVKLAQETALSAALDAVKISDSFDREVVTALILKRGLEPQEVTGRGRVFFSRSEDGTEIELGEAVKDFAASEKGKRYVKAADSSGGGDGNPAPPRPVPASKFETMTPSQRLAASLSPGGVAAGSAPAPQ